MKSFFIGLKSRSILIKLDVDIDRVWMHLSSCVSESKSQKQNLSQSREDIPRKHHLF